MSEKNLSMDPCPTKKAQVGNSKKEQKGTFEEAKER